MIDNSVGNKPDTIVDNHLNQPRELVKGEVLTGVLGYVSVDFGFC